MILSAISVLAGASGSLYVGKRTYNTYRKKKKPWTVYAEKIAKKQKKKRKIRGLFGGGERELQLKEISSTDKARELAPEEKKAQLNLAAASAALTLSVAGALLYSPFLSLASVLFNVVTDIPIFKNAYHMARTREVGVDTLTSVVIIASVFGKYFIALSISSTSYSLSKYLRLKIQDKSSRQLIDVFRQQPRLVWVLVDGVEVEVPFEQLRVGDMVVVHAGGVIPADGTITEGVASIDQHILTGESQPAELGVGQEVFASTVVLSGRICIEVKKAGEETTVARIGDILNNTVEFESKVQWRAERITDQTAWATLIGGTLLFPFLGFGGAGAFVNAHFKYRMSIVAPIGIMNYLGVMSQHQILVKDGGTLDLLSQVDTLVFDKTGTLTEEQPTMTQIHSCSEYDSNQILALAAAVESKQTHLIAKAILQEAKTRQLTLPPIDNTEYKIGYGLTVVISDQIVRVGSARFMEMEKILIPSSIRQIGEFCHHQGHSLVMVAQGDKLIGALELHATVRKEAQEIINQLKSRPNIKSTHIISGDHETPTRKLAQELGIDHYYAETLPQDKANLIEELQSQGRFVCYVGDGINDGVALKKAQVSISLRGASTVATDTAQIILMDQSLNQLVRLFDLADEFKQNMDLGFMMIGGATIVGMTGALFLHFGLLHTIILGHTALTASILNASTPLLKHHWKES